MQRVPNFRLDRGYLASHLIKIIVKDHGGGDNLVLS
jgi:hypothetical protein